MVLSTEEKALVDTVREFVDTQVKPVVRELDHTDTYPEKLIEMMKEIGVFGLVIPEPYGFGRVSMPCYVSVTEELARGWMSLAGAMGGHTVVAELLLMFGTEDQKQRYLPRMATGELRATMALTEPGGGSDLQAMRTVARRCGTGEFDGYVINGSKTWITNARRAGLVALMCKTDPAAEPAHRGVSILLVEKVPGLTVSKDLPKLGYKGVESCELNFSDCRVPADALLGTTEGSGFAQMMKGLEVGRLQVAARATGVARAAFDDALRYAQDRESFGKPIWQHQSVGNLLADMGTKLSAARALLFSAAETFDSGVRCDMEAGMAKLFASEVGMEIALDAVRVHGGHGYSTEYDVERYFRDAPLMIVGEGTNEIQRGVIAKQLVKRGGLNQWGLTEYVADWRPETVTGTDTLTGRRATELAATLDLDHAPRPGDPLPPLWHWVYFTEWPATAALGPDGHPLDGHFLPPIPHRRRMFGGGRVMVHAPLVLGRPATRTAELASTTVKQGRTGELLFVTVRHEFRQDGALRMAEEQDLVYRSDTGATTSFERVTEPLPVSDAPWTFEPSTHPALLFRFSALTANAHRIHYDEDYTTRVEGFPGLVVHGPLLAMYMSELARAHCDRPLRSFEFRLSRPVFVGDPIRVQGTPAADGADLSVTSGAAVVHAGARVGFA